MKFAVPLAQGVLCSHFGHCEEFAILTVEGGKIVNKKTLTPPPHEPGVLPQWLHGLGVQIVIAGGMGRRALDLFAQSGIKVLTGAPNVAPEVLVQHYLDNTLQTGPNVCDH